jgi:peroxiredoxin (alkyl hydroperoxide reductase subunit C)
MNDLPVGRSVDKALRVVQAFQFTVSEFLYFCVEGGADAGRMKDEYGEVCPANRRERGKTIQGDPIAKLDYFVAVDGQHENGKANGTKRVRVD